MVRAKKSLGQHFLRSEKALSDIVHASDIQTGDTVLEIGPGEGVLTRKLLEAGAKVIAVEKDDLLFEKLKNTFKKEICDEKLELVHGDIIEKIDDLDLKKGKYKLVANIPYYITGMILRTFISYEKLPERLVLLVQKEVAERIIARDGKQSILSVMTGLFGRSIIVSTVKKGSFVPAPKVDSAVICIWPYKKQFIENKKSEEFFAEIVKTAFSHKRKLLEKNLENIVDRERLIIELEKIGIEKNIRAEDISIEDWMSLLKELI